jgi:hypothetical protein|tara:strand:+ start:5158 stop:5343 length:186 start_codon:yes stop_codon:yes gene_type:complete
MQWQLRGVDMSEENKEKQPSNGIDKIIDIYNASIGEGTAFDLDYGKIVIIVLCLYIAVQVS